MYWTINQVSKNSLSSPLSPAAQQTRATVGGHTSLCSQKRYANLTFYASSHRNRRQRQSLPFSEVPAACVMLVSNQSANPWKFVKLLAAGKGLPVRKVLCAYLLQVQALEGQGRPWPARRLHRDVHTALEGARRNRPFLQPDERHLP